MDFLLFFGSLGGVCRPVEIGGALASGDGAEGIFEEGGGFPAGAPGVADGIDPEGAVGTNDDFKVAWDVWFHGIRRRG